MMQSEIRTEKEFFEWVRAHLDAQPGGFLSEATFARVWPSIPGKQEPFDVLEANLAFKREDLHWECEPGNNQDNHRVVRRRQVE